MSEQLKLVEGRINVDLHKELVAMTQLLSALELAMSYEERCMRDVIATYHDLLSAMSRSVSDNEGFRDAANQANPDSQDVAGSGVTRPAEGAEGGAPMGSDVAGAVEGAAGGQVGSGDAASLREAAGRRGRSDRDP